MRSPGQLYIQQRGDQRWFIASGKMLRAQHHDPQTSKIDFLELKSDMLYLCTHAQHSTKSIFSTSGTVNLVISCARDMMTWCAGEKQEGPGNVIWDELYRQRTGSQEVVLGAAVVHWRKILHRTQSLLVLQDFSCQIVHPHVAFVPQCWASPTSQTKHQICSRLQFQWPLELVLQPATWSQKLMCGSCKPSRKIQQSC